MKNVMMLLIGFFTLCFNTQSKVFAQDAKFNSGDRLFIYAYNGLNLRSAASLNAKIIQKLDHADEVKVLNVQPGIVEIDHRNSQWLEVEAYGATGFLFGGYLSAVEPMYLDEESFDCTLDIYYMDWVMDVLGESNPILTGEKMPQGSGWSSNTEDQTTFTTYASGDMLYNRTGPDTDSYYFESLSLDYNDILNFMEYLVACQNRFCAYDEEGDKSIFRPIKNIHGELVRVDCTAPLAISAQQKGDRMVVKLETCL